MRASACEFFEEMNDQSTPRLSREQLSALTPELRAKRLRTRTLQREYEQALKEEHSIDSCIKDNLVYYGRSECISITKMMRLKLPIELREMIYRYLCPQGQTIPVGPLFHFRPYTHHQDRDPLASSLAVGRSLTDHSVSPDPALLTEDSHIFDTNYMDPLVASEIQRRYYANNTFSICNVDEAIANFLDFQPFTPLTHKSYARSDMDKIKFESLRSLQVRIKYEHYKDLLVYGLVGGMLPAHEHRNPNLFIAESDILRASNDALAPLSTLVLNKKPLELEFIFMTNFDTQREHPQIAQRYFINLLEAVRIKMYFIMYDRGPVTIKIVHYDENISSFPRDITALWSLKKREWEFEKLANRGKPIWNADFYIAPPDFLVPEGHGGFLSWEQASLLRERWGIDDAFRDTAPKWPIQAGRYWPVGNRSRWW